MGSRAECRTLMRAGRSDHEQISAAPCLQERDKDGAPGFGLCERLSVLVLEPECEQAGKAVHDV